jgi:hypothetical protein
MVAARWASRHELRAAADAAERLIAVMLALAAERRTLPGLLVGDAVPAPWNHYPRNDARDPASGYRHYYHIHQRRPAREHGHFHLFAQARGCAEVTHLLAVAVDGHGRPLRLFTTNRWVTDETLQPAPRVLALLSRFRMRRPARLQPVHDWLEALPALFAPQIRDLLTARDARIRSGRPGLLDDRRIQILSQCNVSLNRHVAQVQRELSATQPGGTP